MYVLVCARSPVIIIVACFLRRIRLVMGEFVFLRVHLVRVRRIPIRIFIHQALINFILPGFLPRLNIKETLFLAIVTVN